MDRRELIERLEKLDGPDREVDAEIYQIEFDGSGFSAKDIIRHWTPEQREDIIPRYTASLDAAIALVEKCLPGNYREISGPRKYLNIPSPVPNKFRVVLITDAGVNSYTAIGWGPSEAIALLIALLRSLSPTEGER